MTPSVALRLGRVSNLPTVWSNTLAGVALAGGQLWTQSTLWLAIGLSLLYVAGMFLNDAFDRDIDALERPERPIPAGLVSANTVFAAGFGLMLAGLAFVLLASSHSGNESSAIAAALALSAAIIFYDWHHKNNPFSPFFMGLCRVLAYLTAGLTITAWPTAALLIAGVVVLSYLIGLTYTAKQEALDRLESLWPLAFLAAPVLYGLVALPMQFSAILFLILAGLVAWIAVALFYLKAPSKGRCAESSYQFNCGYFYHRCSFSCLCRSNVWRSRCGFVLLPHVGSTALGQRDLRRTSLHHKKTVD